MADHYAVLDVSQTADARTVAAAYRRLARRYHPDVNAEPGAVERMRAINAAYAVLADPYRRAAYDARLRASAVHTPGITSRSASSVATAPTYGKTRAVAIGFVAVLVGFVALTCVLSSQVPLTTTSGGYAILPRATATALARGSGPPPDAPTVNDGGPASIDSALGTSQLLQRFPRPVLVPPAGVAPFAGLSIAPGRISGTTCLDDSSMCQPRYVIEFGEWDPTGARLSAFGSRATFNSAIPRTAECAADGQACTVAGAPGRPGATYFRNLSIRADQPGVASVRACCTAPYWLLTWYDAVSDTSYRMELSGAAATLGRSDAAVEPADVVNRLTQLAASLGPLR